jgi:hypothetical protein
MEKIIRQPFEELRSRVENYLSKNEPEKAQKEIIKFYEEHYDLLPQEKKEEVRKLGIQVIKESIKEYADRFNKEYALFHYRLDKRDAEIWSNLAQEMEKISEQELIQKFVKTVLYTIAPRNFRPAIFGALLSSNEELKNQLLLETWALTMGMAEILDNWRDPESALLEEATQTAQFLREEIRKPLLEITSKYSQIREMEMIAEEKEASGLFNTSFKMYQEIAEFRRNTLKEISKYLDDCELQKLLYECKNKNSDDLVHLSILEALASRTSWSLFTPRE